MGNPHVAKKEGGLLWKKKKPINEEKSGKIEYLQMIQGTISRMTTTSAIFKGFTATIVASISAISYANLNKIVLILSFLPVIAFIFLDTYYLSLEKQYRYLFEIIRSDQHPIDFSMQLPKGYSSLCKARATIWDCLRSPSIYLFYPLMLSVLIVLIVLSLMKVI